MKRSFLSIILFLSFSVVFSQWSETYNIEGKCSHMPADNNFKSLDHIYDWQSDYLNDYDITFYFLDIEVSNTTTFVSGNVTINAGAVVLLDTFAFELLEVMEVDSFFMNGVKYETYFREGDNVLVPVAEIPSGQSFSVQIFYQGNSGTTGFLSGLHKNYSEKYDKHMVYSLSEPFGAKSWFPVKQDLEDKADSCWVFLTTGSENMAGAQGLLTNTVDLGNGKTRYEWKSNYPIDYYLISFAVTDYMEYNIYAYPEAMNGDSILIQNYIYNDPQCLANNKNGMDATAEMIEVFSDLFSLYPFHEEKYGHCLTQLGGGMEHQTMTTIGNFGFDLVAHELGHMWFGDNITCATWSDIWINEGFATYSNYLAQEYIHGWDAGKTFITGAQNSAMSQPGGSVYIPEDQITQENQWRIFNGRLSYNKGAAIIHMLRHEIQDDELFFDVLRTYQTSFKDSTATGDDFKNVAENVTGMDFDQFFDQWYYGQGYPNYDLVYYMDEGTFHLTATQTSSSPVTTLFKMLMEYRLNFDDGSDTIVKFEQTDNVNIFSVYTGKYVTSIDVDPEAWTMEKIDGISVTVEETELPVYFTIGPNPVKDVLNIYFLNNRNDLREIKIMDLSGKMLYQEESANSSVHVYTNELANGVYLVQVSDGNNTLFRRFVK